MAPRASSDGTGTLAAVGRFWRSSYAPDYLGLTILLTGYLFFIFFVEPFHRMFSISDLSISFPHAEHERVPVLLNIVYAAGVPVVFLLLTNAVTGASVHKHHVTLLGLAIAIFLTTSLTDLVKNAVGRPRPDLIARCKPKAGTPEHTLVTWEVCTEPNGHILHDGWRSFPSGHSSFSFAGLGYTAMFLAGQLRVFVLRHHTEAAAAAAAAAAERDRSAGGSRVGLGSQMELVVHAHGGHDLGRALLCMVPLVGATMIAISRCQDYRHDVYDVCTGALLGTTVAFWSYRRYWPRLASVGCSEPYPSPAASSSEEGRRGGYGRVRDLEDGGGDSASGLNVGHELRELRRA